MPSVLNSISNSVRTSTTSTQPSPDSPSTPASSPLSAIQPKKKFRTFGIASRSRSPAVHNGGLHSDTEDDWQHPVLITTGNESSTAVGGQRRHPSVTDTSFFESSAAGGGNAGAIASSAASKKSQPPSTRSRASSLEVEEMKIDLVQADAVASQHQNKTPLVTRSAARPNFRLIPQWGPWTVSVAETPTDPTVYNIYIKSASLFLSGDFASLFIFYPLYAVDLISPRSAFVYSAHSQLHSYSNSTRNCRTTQQGAFLRGYHS